MTKDEVLAAIANHRTEVRACFLSVEGVLASLISGWVPSGGEAGTISNMKDLLDRGKALITEAEDTLDEWPL